MNHPPNKGASVRWAPAYSGDAGEKRAYVEAASPAANVSGCESGRVWPGEEGRTEVSDKRMRRREKAKSIGTLRKVTEQWLPIMLRAMTTMTTRHRTVRRETVRT